MITIKTSIWLPVAISLLTLQNPKSMAALHLALLCQHVLSHCPKLAERWIRLLQSHPCTAANPWGIVVGYDEFQPGNKFDFDSTKAVMCLYFNFVEIDDASQGSTWFAPITTRMSEINDVVGGWSRVLACILHRMFLGPNGFSTAGCAFTHEDRHYVVFAGLRVLMSDGDGLRKGLGWKGASAIRASIIHSNMLKKGSDLAWRAPVGSWRSHAATIGCCTRQLQRNSITHAIL